LVYHLKQVPGTSQTRTLESLAESIEKSSSLTAEDVVHAVRALAREMKQVFLSGDRVKIDGLGIFSLTFNATEVATEKECNVKTIKKVNIRFRADRDLRLENESTARVRNGYGVKFAVADMRTQKKAALRAAQQQAEVIGKQEESKKETALPAPPCERPALREGGEPAAKPAPSFRQAPPPTSPKASPPRGRDRNERYALPWNKRKDRQAKKAASSPPVARARTLYDLFLQNT
jgi:predicted histone-like DNA-binding protein